MFTVETQTEKYVYNPETGEIVITNNHGDKAVMNTATGKDKSFLEGWVSGWNKCIEHYE